MYKSKTLKSSHLLSHYNSKRQKEKEKKGKNKKEKVLAEIARNIKCLLKQERTFS